MLAISSGVSHSIWLEKGGHNCPHRTDEKVQVCSCVSPVTNFGMESNFTDSFPNATSPDFLFTRKLAEVAYMHLVIWLVLLVSGIQSKKLISNIGIKPTFYTFCSSNT